MIDSNNENARKKNPGWFYLILLIIPLVIIIFIELILTISDYGNDYEQWVSLDEKYEILNPEIARKYFSGIENIPFSTESFLLKNKPKNSFRVIVLGASSGAGYPYQNSGSFSKYIRKALELTVPSYKFEVANISMAAINSYTILDLLPDVISKNPDLILIYLGHNEFYGAMGVGSTQSLADSPVLINIVLYMRGFKIFQLVENITKYIASATTSSSQHNDQTLMAKIAGDKLIEFKSDKYIAGIEQFKSNMNDILKLCKKSDIPVIMGTLVSNLKDLQPFNSVDTDTYEPADKVFGKAETFLKKGMIESADSLFRLAKDLDGLRFRAPEEFNKILRNLSLKYGYAIADSDSAMAVNSPEGIVGDNLMVDHLHPNLKGYQIIGKTMFSEILRSRILNDSNNPADINLIDEEIRLNYNFTKYDSAIAALKIKKLKSDWPFVETNKSPKVIEEDVNDIETKIAKEVLSGKISRLEARLILAEHYYEMKDYISAVDELLAMMESFPTENKRVHAFVEDLINIKKYDLVGPLLNESYKLGPDEFNSKWLGIMHMSNGQYDLAGDLLLKSFELNPNDPQVLFNLSGIYLKRKEYLHALEYVNKCLKLSPNYQNAKLLKSRITGKINN